MQPLGKRALALGVSIVSVLTLGPAGATVARSSGPEAIASANVAPGTCPTIMPEADVAAGQVGTGWTVEEGQHREAFKVKILGVLPDGIAPGLDMIVIRVSDTSGNDMIKRAGGIWAGMSGSPVYIGGKLVGAVSYGFTGAPSAVGGMTPAEPMVNLVGYPPTAGAVTGARQVTLPAPLAARVARAGAMSTGRASSLTRLAIPLAVSGLTAEGRARLQQRLNDSGLDVIVTSGNSKATPSGTTTYDTPQAGGNFAGLLSYGDVTSGGIGTTTYVCGNTAVAFGHPLTFGGRVKYGASNASAITVVRDDTFGSFKLATIGAPFGRLDQDRLAGIRTTLAQAPQLIPVTSEISVPFLGRTRNGETDVAGSEIVAPLAAEHLFQNVIVTLDKQGPGNAAVAYTVHGRRANGDAWSLTRSNRISSTRDIAGAIADDLFGDLSLLSRNAFEPIKFSSVDITGTIAGVARSLTIQDVLFSRNGGEFKHRSSLNVHPGDHVTARVTLSTGTATQTRDISIDVPAIAPGPATLVIAGGSGTLDECLFGGTCGTSFPDLLSIIQNAPANNDLVAQLLTFNESTFQQVVSASAKRTLPSVVSGNFQLNVNIQ